jgi:hypothetical protein
MIPDLARPQPTKPPPLRPRYTLGEPPAEDLFR